MKLLLTLCVFLLAVSTARAETWVVGEQGRSLAATLAAAQDGDVVEVGAGSTE